MNCPERNEKVERPALWRRSHFIRDNLEGLLTAVVLALIIRHFVFEVFVIPTGSMAPTLLGQHRDLICPNCGYGFELDSSDNPGTHNAKVLRAMCPNCGYAFPDDVVRRAVCTCSPAWPRRLFWRGGNRVIVNKFRCHFRAPRRWDVIVFRYPRQEYECRSCGASLRLKEDEAAPDACPRCGSRKLKRVKKNYIKRLVGLPGERIEIRHGDIYVNGKIARKPRSVQGHLWQFVYDSRHRIREKQGIFDPRWVAVDGAFSEDEGGLALRTGTDGSGLIRYGPRIVDYNAYNGEPAAVEPGMGDLRVEVRVKLDRPGAMRLHINEDDTRHVATVRFGNSRFRTALRTRGEAIAESDLTLDPGTEHDIVFSNADDRIELRVDGKLALEYDFDIPLPEVPTGTWDGGVFLGVEGARAVVSSVRIDRDLYYVSDDPRADPRFCPVTDVPERHFFVLGDNSRKSYDGRFWGYVPEDHLIGNAEVIWWPLNHLRVVR